MTQSGTASQTQRPSLQPLPALPPDGTSSFVPQDNPKGYALPDIGAPSETYQSSLGLATGDGFCPKPTATFDGICNNLTYQGGSVMHNVQFVLLLWAGCGSDGCINCQTGYFDNPTVDPNATNPNDCTYANLILQYFEDFCNDQPMLDLVNQYTDGLGPMGSCSVFGGTTWVSWAPFPSNPLADSDIQDIASTAIDHLGVQPAPFPIVDTEVLVFTPFGEGSCDSSGACFPGGGWCAYHGSSFLQSFVPPVIVAYANIPDVGSFSSGGKSCGIKTFNSKSPTSDPFADAAINMGSHESIESITDPVGDGWFFNDGKHEISDECNFDFNEVEPDNSTVHLGVNGDPFLIQPEWSNVNGGCTFDLAGAPAQTVITLTPDTSTGTAATWPSGGFPIIFQEAGEGKLGSPSFTLLFLRCCSGVMIIFVTPDGGPDFNNLYIDPVVNVPVVNAPEEWCFDASCIGPPPTYVSGAAFVQYVFYDLLAQHPYVCFNPTIVCSPPPSSFGTNGFTVNLQYATAPSFAGIIDTTQTVSLTLGTIPNNFMALAVNGSEASWPNCTPFNNFLGFSCGNAGERYSNGGVCTSLLDCSTSRAVTSADSITNLDYWDQYLVPVKYFTSDLSTIPSTPPSFTGMAFGVATIPLVLSTSPQNVWLDSASAWSVSPQTLTGSTSTVRWFAPVVSGFESWTNPINVVYIHQYYVIFVVGLGSGSTSPLSSWQNAGSTITITALPAPGYKFAAWTSSTSMIRLAYYATPTTKATINGPGTITVLFHP